MLNTQDTNNNQIVTFGTENSYFLPDNSIEINPFNGLIISNSRFINLHINDITNPHFIDEEFDFEHEPIEDFPSYGDLVEQIALNTSFERTSNNIFKTRLFLNKGRKRSKKYVESNKKKHGKYDFDNIITKVQVHFIKFIINVSNDIIKTFLGKNTDLYFKDIDYNIKRNVKFSHLEYLKNLKLKDIITKNISKKFISLDRDHNEKVYNNIIKANNINCNYLIINQTKKDSPIILNQREISKFLNDFFNMNFLALFDLYYYKPEPSNKIIINGIEIVLSKKTKTFSELINKNNSLMKNLLIQFTKRAYFGEVKSRERNSNLKQIFNIKKNQ